MELFDRVKIDSPFSHYHGRKGYVSDTEEGIFLPYRVRLECGAAVWFDETELEVLG